jgi:hypothetical protein
VQEKEKEEELNQSQRGAVNKFITKKSQVSTDNRSVDSSTLALDIIPYHDSRDSH